MQANGVIGGYVIGGAVGATFYLEPSATEDIDIFVLLPTLPGSFFLELTPVYEYLKGRGSKVEGERILVGDWLVQFLRANGPLEREALDEAVHTEVEGVPTFVPRAEHLVWPWLYGWAGRKTMRESYSSSNKMSWIWTS